MKHVAFAVASLAAVSSGSTRALAQSAHPVAELRADALFGTPRTQQLGLGVNVPMGYYVRLTTLGAYGIAEQNGQSSGAGRVDVLMRFLLDPFREHQYGLSAGGGLSVQKIANAHWRPFLTLVTDLELPRHGAWAPAIQAGLGGGARIGVILRGTQAEFRD